MKNFGAPLTLNIKHDNRWLCDGYKSDVLLHQKLTIIDYR